VISPCLGSLSSSNMQLSRIPVEDLGPVMDRLWGIIPQSTSGAATLLEQITSQEQRLTSSTRAKKVPITLEFVDLSKEP